MSLVPATVRQGAWAQVLMHRRRKMRIGFIPLTDCASVVMASVLKLDEKYGIKIIPSKEASWAAVRDKLVNGELDAAHVLYGLVYGVHLGIGGPKKDMAVLMTLNNNGQAISLSNQLKDKGVTDGASLAALMKKEKREYTFAQTFPDWHPCHVALLLARRQRHQSVCRCQGNHRPAAANGGQHASGQYGRLCVGEPWNARGRSSTRSASPQSPRRTSGRITPKRCWHDRRIHQEVSEHGAGHDGCDSGSVALHRSGSRQKKTATIPRRQGVREHNDGGHRRSLGKANTTTGLAKKWTDANAMKFLKDGATNYPYLSDGMWFLTQHKRWGLLKRTPTTWRLPRRSTRRTSTKGSCGRQGGGAEERPAFIEADRRRRLGRQQSEGVRRRFQDQGLSAVAPARAVTSECHAHCYPDDVAACRQPGACRPDDTCDPAPRRPQCCLRRRRSRQRWPPTAQRRQQRRRAGVASNWLPSCSASSPHRGHFAVSLLWRALPSGWQFPWSRESLGQCGEAVQRPVLPKGPNDQGIGWNIISSLKRVGIGFGLAALVGIPLGFVIGRFATMDRMTAPIISILRPVSPLAWLPIGLMVFKAANPRRSG